jgi:hypothetical protein
MNPPVRKRDDPIRLILFQRLLLFLLRTSTASCYLLSSSTLLGKNRKSQNKIWERGDQVEKLNFLPKFDINCQICCQEIPVSFFVDGLHPQSTSTSKKIQNPTILARDIFKDTNLA